MENKNVIGNINEIISNLQNNLIQTEKVPFVPIVGTNEKIMGLEQNEGHIYFATDTKKIYMDTKDQNKIPMGGNSGIYYGLLEIDPDTDTDITQFDFELKDIEGNISNSPFLISAL